MINIKPELQEEYDKYVAINQEDEYSKQVITCGELFMKGIDSNKTLDEALDSAVKGFGLTGYMVGALIETAAHFHQRGDEIKSWWNKRYGGTGEEKGTINPAIVTMKSND